MQVMAETATILEALIAAAPAVDLARAPKPDAWSPLEALGHLADMEWVFGFRARTILCDQPRPTLAGIDQDRWVTLQQPAKHEAQVWLARFRAAREVNLAFWQGLPDAVLARAGWHADAAVEIPLSLLRRIIAGHDLLHIDLLRRDLDLLAP